MTENITMSDQDDTLLDEDFGDEEYNLGNEEEEALLADDNDFERLPEKQTISKGEEETDDILDLGVTDPLDDLEVEEENVQFKINNDKHEQEKSYSFKINNMHLNEMSVKKSVSSLEWSVTPVKQPKIDLREKLKKKASSQLESFAKINQVTDDDDCEEENERRNRFQNERVTIPSKVNLNIPDSLENITIKYNKSHNKNYDKCGKKSDKVEENVKNENKKNNKISKDDRNIKSDRINIKGRNGGRYDVPQSGRYQCQAPLSSNHQILFRNKISENRSSFAAGPLINNVPIKLQHNRIYPVQNPQIQAPYHHSIANSPIPGHNRFSDGSIPLLSHQFPEPVRLQAPSCMNPTRIDYNSRGPIIGLSGRMDLPSNIHNHLSNPSSGPPGLSAGTPGPPNITGPSSLISATYNCQPNSPPFPPSNQSMFSNHPIHTVERVPSLSGPSISAIPNNSGVSHLPANLGAIVPVSQELTIHAQNFVRSQVPNQVTLHQNHLNAPSQPVYENRVPFPESQFEATLNFDTRNSYSNLSENKFNNSTGSQIVRSTTQNATSSTSQIIVVPGVTSIPNVPIISTGHKILINPHFRGNQAKSNSKIIQDSADKFVQALRSASNLHDNHLCNQVVRSDDPFSYFSDVWQESKSQRCQNSSLRRSYSPDNSYSKGSNHNYDKYKSDSYLSHKDSFMHKEEHKICRDMCRERESPPRIRNDKKSYISSPNINHYRNDNHDLNISKINEHKIVNIKLLNCSTKDQNKSPLKRLGGRVPVKNKKEFSKKKSESFIRFSQHDEKAPEKPVVKEDETDPEMEEYRKKMEEQKRLREKFLREKENRRKLAALEKQNLAPSIDIDKKEHSIQESIFPAVIKGNPREKINIAVEKGRVRLVNKQSGVEKLSGLRIVRTIKQQKLIYNKSNKEDETNIDDNYDCDDGGKGKLLSRIILNRAKKTLLQKNSIQNTQKASTSKTANAHRQLGQIRQLLTDSKRIVVSNINSKHQQIAAIPEQHQRIVINKSSTQETKKLIKSNVVKIDNLAASTTEAQIRRMCQGIGSIESVQMGDSNATIVFKTQSAAMVFHKKYQRKMLDLSLIRVQLIPQTSGFKM